MAPSHIPAGVSVVDAYRNLNTGTWSAKAFRAPAQLVGKVVAHPDSMELMTVEFRVQAKGRDVVRATCNKGVHAFVRGTVDRLPAAWPPRLVVDVGYNPYLFDTFVLMSNFRPVHRAAWVKFPAKRADGSIAPLQAGLYDDDEDVIGMSRVAVSKERIARMTFCRLPAPDRRRLAAEGKEVPMANPAVAPHEFLTNWNG